MALVSALLSSCAGLEKPRGDICGINAHNKTLRCYRMDLDFDDRGERLPNAKPIIKPMPDLKSLNGGIYFDSDSWAEARRFKGDLLQKLDECQ